MFGACFATLTFPRVQAPRACGRQRVAAGSQQGQCHPVPIHPAPSSPSSTGRGQEGWEDSSPSVPFGGHRSCSWITRTVQPGIELLGHRDFRAARSLGHSPFHPQRQEGSQGRGSQRAPFQPKVPKSSCPREPQATSPSVPRGLGAIPIGTKHSPHPTAHPTSTSVLPTGTPHCGRGVGPAIATAPLAELPILMAPSSVPNPSLLSQCQAR